jgi:RNA-directed DNA polymerase
MTTGQTVGAVSSEAAEWYAIDWQAIHRNVRRLQVRIVKAVKEGRWGKVRALQCNEPRLFSSWKVIFLRLIPGSRAVIARARRVAA